MSDIRTLGSREVYANPWMRLREDAVEYADGTPSTYTVVERPDFVTLVPWDGAGFWIVEQYRYPLGRRCWEFPQGAWPAGKGGTTEELAHAELAEETGLRAGRLVHLGRLASAPALMPQQFDVFAALDLTEGDPDREVTEADMVHRHVTERELRELIADGRFADCHSLAALTLFDLVRDAL